MPIAMNSALSLSRPSSMPLTMHLFTVFPQVTELLGKEKAMAENGETRIPKLITPTDTLIKAMEQAEQMEACIVIYRMKEDAGMGFVYNLMSFTERAGMLEEAKFSMFCDEYGIKPHEE